MKTTNEKSKTIISLCVAAMFLFLAAPAAANITEEDSILSWYDNPTVKKGQKMEVFQAFVPVWKLENADVTHHWYDSGMPMKGHGGESTSSNATVKEPMDHGIDPTESWYSNGVPAAHR